LEAAIVITTLLHQTFDRNRRLDWDIIIEQESFQIVNQRLP
jgi:hypothetical protein